MQFEFPRNILVPQAQAYEEREGLRLGGLLASNYLSAHLFRTYFYKELILLVKIIYKTSKIRN